MATRLTRQLAPQYWLIKLQRLDFPPQLFRPKSRNFPSLGSNPNIWAFVQQVTQEVEEMKCQNFFTDNLSPRLWQALTSLQKNSELIIKPADKGGNLVVMDHTKYELLCLRIFKNREWYRPISQTVIESYYREFRNIITCALSNGLIDKQTWSYLNIQEPIVPTFYALPKVHKSLTNPPGQPIL